MQILLLGIEMILNELYGYRGIDEVPLFKNAVQNVNQHDVTGRKNIFKMFMNSLSTKGYVPLGNGAFATVFTHPKLNYAIKVFKNDPAYLKFFDYCSKHKDNQHLPKFIGKPLTIDKEHYLIRMEKLVPMKEKPIFDDSISRTINDLEKDRGSFLMDLHDDNFMKRPDGTVVIVDPYVDWSQLD